MTIRGSHVDRAEAANAALDERARDAERINQELLNAARSARQLLEQIDTAGNHESFMIGIVLLELKNAIKDAELYHA